jgi:hypothetical protein
MFRELKSPGMQPRANQHAWVHSGRPRLGRLATTTGTSAASAPSSKPSPNAKPPGPWTTVSGLAFGGRRAALRISTDRRYELSTLSLMSFSAAAKAASPPIAISPGERCAPCSRSAAPIPVSAASCRTTVERRDSKRLTGLRSRLVAWLLRLVGKRLAARSLMCLHSTCSHVLTERYGAGASQTPKSLGWPAHPYAA